MSDCRTTATQLLFTMFDGKMLEQNIGLTLQRPRIRYTHSSFVSAYYQNKI